MNLYTFSSCTTNNYTYRQKICFETLSKHEYNSKVSLQNLDRPVGWAVEYTYGTSAEG